MSDPLKGHASAARRVVSAIFFMCGTFIGMWASRIPHVKEATGLDEIGFGLFMFVVAARFFYSVL